MRQTWKIVIAVVVTAAIVGGGVYFWQQNEKREATQIMETQKVFKGNGYSFVYPEKYIADSKGLWTKDGFESHINPPEACSLCQVPYIEVKTEATNKTLDQYIIADLSLPGNNLKEMSKKTDIPYENLKLGDNDFTKITVSSMLTTTGYYTKHDNTIVAFLVSSDKWDDNELRSIIKSLKFE